MASPTSTAALRPPQPPSRSLSASRSYAPLTTVHKVHIDSLGDSADVYISGGFWDFTSDLASKDTAYTNLALKAHTDTTYFTDPVRLQMFHLLSHTEGEGGVSLLVDGLRASNQLRRDFPDAFHILAKHRVPCHSNGNTGVSIRPSHAIPVLNRFFTSGTKVKQVRWNNSDRATLSTVASGAWYDAARKWVNILERPESEYWEQLKPGRALSKL